MLTIYKYKIEGDLTEIYLPNEHQVLSFQVQNEEPVIWVKLDNEKQKFKRHFALITTGEDMDEKVYKGSYCGTIQMYHGGLNFHLFEL